MKTVRDIVVEMPFSVKVFEQLGIDYCCGGDKRLDEACRAAGLELQNVTQALTAAGKTVKPEGEIVDWSGRSMSSLMNHIVEKHHSFCRQEVARLEPLLDKVIQAHGTAHPELRRIKTVFSGLSKELLMHLTKEEQTLFPHISRMEESSKQGVAFPRPAFGTVQNPVRMMVLEHDNAGAALQQIRNLTSNYQLPSDACNSYQTLYDGLKSFETDMHQHVHLENNVLFPRAIAMEDAVLSNKTVSAG